MGVTRPHVTDANGLQKLEAVKKDPPLEPLGAAWPRQQLDFSPKLVADFWPPEL